VEFCGKKSKSYVYRINRSKQNKNHRRINTPNRYFNITPAAAAEQPSVINTPQSALTFAGAPAIVTIVVKVLGEAVPAWSQSKLLLVGLSLGVGLVIYWSTAATGLTIKDKVLGVVLALINSFAIAAAALGIEQPLSS
jgi:hypothetical protein